MADQGYDSGCRGVASNAHKPIAFPSRLFPSMEHQAASQVPVVFALQDADRLLQNICPAFACCPEVRLANSQARALCLHGK